MAEAGILIYNELNFFLHHICLVSEHIRVSMCICVNARERE